MKEQFRRTAMLLGEEAVEQLHRARVAIFGVGGVGGFVAEALARSGVDITNINRQIIALHSTVGRQKTEVMKERILDINPEAEVEIRSCFFLPENQDAFDFSAYSYVVDAVDTVTAKLTIVEKCTKLHIPVISAMGAGNKLDPTGFEVADIAQTSVCPLAKVMRRELKRRGIYHLKVVYSKELPVTNQRPPGSVAFVPSVAGLIIASEIVKDLTIS